MSSWSCGGGRPDRYGGTRSMSPCAGGVTPVSKYRRVWATPDTPHRPRSSLVSTLRRRGKAMTEHPHSALFVLLVLGIIGSGISVAALVFSSQRRSDY